MSLREGRILPKLVCDTCTLMAGSNAVENSGIQPLDPGGIAVGMGSEPEQKAQ
jgi:hypothetical protein